MQVLYVIYDHPKDWPDFFVVRRWYGLLPGVARLARTIEGARALVPAGCVRIKRAPSDDPVIVESWL